MKKFVVALCSLGFIASAQAQLKVPEAEYEQVREQFGQLNLTVNAVASVCFLNATDTLAEPPSEGAEMLLNELQLPIA